MSSFVTSGKRGSSFEKSIIGIDIGGTAVKAALVRFRSDFQFKIVKVILIPMPVNLEILINLLSERVKQKLKGEKVRAVGIGVAGMVDHKKGLLLYAPNLKAKNLPVGKMVSKVFGLPAYADNDANLYALGEWVIWKGKERNIVALTVGTGVGNGIIIDGRIFRGSNLTGAESGHMKIMPGGPQCGCGQRGCLEALVAKNAIVRYYRSFSNDTQTPEVIAERARAGDKAARAAYEQSAYYLGLGVSNLLNIFNPERVVIGGGMSKSKNLIKERLERTVRELTLPVNLKGVKITYSKNPDVTGSLGAAYFAYKKGRL